MLNPCYATLSHLFALPSSLPMDQTQAIQLLIGCLKLRAGVRYLTLLWLQGFLTVASPVTALEAEHGLLLSKLCLSLWLVEAIKLA
ncbi:hypothetical protein MHYP_G00272560 [Metynnis hypsauchen]